MKGRSCLPTFRGAWRAGSLRFAETKLTAGHGVRTGSMARTVMFYVPGDTFQVLPRTAERGCGGESILVDRGTVRVPSSWLYGYEVDLHDRSPAADPTKED